MARADGDVDLLLVGERAALGPLRSDLARTYARWWNDMEVRRGLSTLDVWTDAAAAKWVAEAGGLTAERDPDAAHFTIYAAADLEPVGTLALMKIDHRNRRADFGILLGVRRGEGIGTDATRLALRWAFEVVGLENVILTVLPSNPAGIAAYEKAGFRVVGRRRRAAATMDGCQDEILMDAVPGDPPTDG
jgi:RimJ/RimL family protein N-acetyltransferase